MQDTLMLCFKGDAVPFAFQVDLRTYMRFYHLQNMLLIEKEAVIKGISDYDSALKG